MTTRFEAAAIRLIVAAISFRPTFVIRPAGIPLFAPAAAQALGYGLVVAVCLAMGGAIALAV